MMRMSRSSETTAAAIAGLTAAGWIVVASAGDQVAIGAIRWDAWHTPAAGDAHGGTGGPVRAMERSLNPKQYRHRAPFFARVDTNDTLRIDGYTQAIVDSEIEFARAGGIDYWAFLLYDEDNVMSQGLKLYLSSARRAEVKFCAIACAGVFGPPQKWDAGIARLVRLMREPGYKAVCGNRPLLYVFRVEDRWIQMWGGEDGARRLFDRFRAAAREAGLADPYLVVMDTAGRAKRMADMIGAEAVSDYARAHRERGAPYSALAQAARAFWDECEATGAEVVPLAMAGWDRRPRVEHPVPWEKYQKPGVGIEYFYVSPTPDELAAHIGEAIDWVEARPERCPARTVLVYAWNEHDEGGWLCPDLGEGDARLRAIRRMLDARKSAAKSELRVSNGDFDDTAGMQAIQGGWFSGLPPGWRGVEGVYAVHVQRGATSPVCNLSLLGFLRQEVGRLSRASDVVLSFDVSEPWRPDARLEAEILDTNMMPLALGEFGPGDGHRLEAANVPAGTAVTIAFRATASAPGLDNVSVAATPSSAPARAAREAVDERIEVAAYYFGNYHPGDPRNEKQKGKGWSEWELVKAARPRFPGHRQPIVPLWGYTDESDPREMERKIDAAADHGIDAFIFVWCYYDDGPFLNRPIDIGFLQARNNARLKFAFMWANTDWMDIHPYKRGAEHTVLYPGVVTPETFDRMCDRMIRTYFAHPSYWRIDGRPYFSVYELVKLVRGFGSVKATREALDRFRAKAVAAGLPGVHLNAVAWGRRILPGEETPADPVALVKDLGFDSVTSYVWVHHVALPKLQTDYVEVRDGYFNYWNSAIRRFAGVPYYPNVTMGWDSSPRAHQDDEFGNFGYPFTNTIGGNTPERFKEALEMTRRRLLSMPDGPRILNINCWNEWTEGSYLEPDTVHGMRYLEAVRDVFGSRP